MVRPFEPTSSVDIIQAIGQEVRSQNSEVSSSLIVHMNSKFIGYHDFPHKMLMEEEEIRCLRNQKKARLL